MTLATPKKTVIDKALLSVEVHINTPVMLSSPQGDDAHLAGFFMTRLYTKRPLSIEDQLRRYRRAVPLFTAD